MSQPATADIAPQGGASRTRAWLLYVLMTAATVGALDSKDTRRPGRGAPCSL